MKNLYNIAKYYLFNYDKIDEMIEDREEEIIDNICPNVENYLKGFNTVETQVIALIEDKRIKMLKRWQVQIKNVLVFLRKRYPMAYKVIIMKYFKRMSDEEIQKTLKLNFKQIKYIDNKVIEKIIKRYNNGI